MVIRVYLIETGREDTKLLWLTRMVSMYQIKPIHSCPTRAYWFAFVPDLIIFKAVSGNFIGCLKLVKVTNDSCNNFLLIPRQNIVSKCVPLFCTWL